MDTAPRVSVVVAAYNQGSYVAEALDSILGQTLAHRLVEVIVINDGSTDETASVLRTYQTRLRVIEREHRGLVPSCNEGLALAQAPYFARVDSDDRVASEWLESLLGALESDPAACCAVPDRSEREGSEQRRIEVDPTNIYSLVACGTLFRTGAVRLIGGFRPMYWEEYDLYLRLRGLGRFLRVPKPLYIYRKHARGMTHQAAARREGWLQLAGAWPAATLRAAGSDPELEQALRQLERAR